MKRDLLAAPLFALALGLAGCAATGGAPVEPPVASAWQAPLPHHGDVAELRRWWTQFDDPLLARLVDAADTASPTIASAAARIEDARARGAAAGALLLPSLGATANAGRARQDVSIPAITSEGIGLQASWEIDVFGRNRAARDAAEARVEGAGASWHDARVIVAAETANLYIALRACESLLEEARLDAQSRAETARLTELSMQSGFESRANAALARASAAQGSVLTQQQSEQCEQIVKALVALTGIAEPDLRAQLAGERRACRSRRRSRCLPFPPPRWRSVPTSSRARATSSPPAPTSAPPRPTAGRASRSPAASARPASSRAFGTFSGATWSIGPVGVSLPVFDAGARRANVVAARVRYDEATSAYARDAAQCDPRGRDRADRPAGHRRPQRRRADRRRQLRGLLTRHRGALPERLRDAVRARGRTPERPGGADHPDQPAPRARRRLDRALSCARRRLVAACRRPDRCRLLRPAPHRHDPSLASTAPGRRRRRRHRCDGRARLRPARERCRRQEGGGPGQARAERRRHPAPTLDDADLDARQRQRRRLAGGSIGTEASGLRLAEVRVNVGDVVKRGQVLATFAPDTMQADLAQTRAAVAEAEATLGRRRRQRRARARAAATGALSDAADQPVRDRRADRARPSRRAARGAAGAASCAWPDRGHRA